MEQMNRMQTGDTVAPVRSSESPRIWTGRTAPICIVVEMIFSIITSVLLVLAWRNSGPVLMNCCDMNELQLEGMDSPELRRSITHFRSMHRHVRMNCLEQVLGEWISLILAISALHFYCSCVRFYQAVWKNRTYNIPWAPFMVVNILTSIVALYLYMVFSGLEK